MCTLFSDTRVRSYECCIFASSESFNESVFFQIPPNVVAVSPVVSFSSASRLDHSHILTEQTTFKPIKRTLHLLPDGGVGGGSGCGRGAELEADPQRLRRSSLRCLKPSDDWLLLRRRGRRRGGGRRGGGGGRRRGRRRTNLNGTKSSSSSSNK